MDGTETLCRAVYKRKAAAKDYVGGADANMLYDAATAINQFRGALAASEERVRVLSEILDKLSYEHSPTCHYKISTSDFDAGNCTRCQGEVARQALGDSNASTDS